MPEKVTRGKRKLYLVKVLEPKSYREGQPPLLPFQAKDLSLEAGNPLMDKILRFTIFTPELQEYLNKLPPDSIFIADYIESPPKDPQYSPDFTVVQIYDKDGKPVSARKQWGGGGRSSPEDRASNEMICVISTTASLWIAGKFKDDDLEVKRLRLWLMTKYVPGVATFPKPAPPKPEIKQLDMPLDTTTKTPALEPGTVSEELFTGKAPIEEKEPPVKNVGDLRTRARNYDINTLDEVLRLAGVDKVANLGNLDIAWAKIKAAKPKERGK